MEKEPLYRAQRIASEEAFKHKIDNLVRRLLLRPVLKRAYEREIEVLAEYGYGPDHAHKDAARSLHFTRTEFVSEPSSAPYIICGWFTADYRPWAERFAASLRRHGAPYDLIEAEKDRRGWEATTRMKPAIVQGFLEKYPGKALILSDVDALAMGDLSPLADLDCDIALRLQAKRLRGRNMIVPRSGTVVLYLGWRTFAFVETWRRHCEAAPYGDTDESCLNLALAGVEGLRVVNLQHNSEPGSLTRHDRGSLGKVKVSHLKRALRWITRRR
jgi:hypothetical protein